MKRRGFIGSLIGFLAAPNLPITSPLESSGIIYAPYIPIIKYRNIEDMLLFQISMYIQKEIDREVIDKLYNAAKKMG